MTMNKTRWLITLLLAALASSAALAQTVKLATSMGDVVIQLDADKAPKTVANFVQYVKDGHYDGLIFHRVISTFMIQGSPVEEIGADGMRPNGGLQAS